MKQNTSQKGFVILFAVLISAIILLIGAGVLSISVKESVLASAAREAQYAINAADAGIECVLYDDAQPYDFAFNGLLNDTTNPRVSCLGSVQTLGLDPFQFEIPDPLGGQGTCAIVTRTSTFPTNDDVANGLVPDQVNWEKITLISQGFNLCDNENPVYVDPLLVERVLRVIYFKPTSA